MQPVIMRDIEQGTELWKALRVGRPTASGAKSIVTGAGKPASPSVQRTYLSRLVAECFGELFGGEGSKAMQRGRELEDSARAAYSLDIGQDVETVGFIWRDERREFGVSPDGLVGDEGGVEIKVPNLATHVAYLHAGVVPAEYRPQVFANLETSGRDWWDFYSYAFDPRIPAFRCRVHKADKDFRAWREAWHGTLPVFVAELDEMRRAVGLQPLSRTQPGESPPPPAFPPAMMADESAILF